MPPTIADRARSLTRFELSPRHRPPGVVVVGAVTVLCAALSLLADELIVRAGTAAFPATRGYVHFQFGDYAKLTVIGVVAAGVGWPIVARLTSAPRWAFVRLGLITYNLLVRLAPVRAAPQQIR
jgi:hypothetical protein